MKKAVRRSFVCVVAASLVAVTVAHTGWSDEGMEFWHLTEHTSNMENESRRSRELASTSNALKRRIEIKTELVADWIAGDRAFAELVDEFYLLNQQFPSQIRIIEHSYPGDTIREKQARNVHDFCCATARSLSYETHELKSRADTDLEAFLMVQVAQADSLDSTK